MEAINQRIQKRFSEMTADAVVLFRSAVTGDQLWDLYISSFGEEMNPVFRDPESSSHNCNSCKSFIRRYGNIVAIDPVTYAIQSMFDGMEDDEEYGESFKNMSLVLRNTPVADVFAETKDMLVKLAYEKAYRKGVFCLGVQKNVKLYTKEEADKFGVVSEGETRVFNHLHVDIPSGFIHTGKESAEAIAGQARDAYNVFRRAMYDIPLDTLELVRDLIQQGSLLNGDAHLYKVEQMIVFKTEFDATDAGNKINWCRLRSYGNPLAKFRNELIGVLCTELAEGKELNDACQAWNKRVDPANYMKATAPITKNQIDQARKFVQDNGYEESFARRHATIDDIRVSEILHSNVGDGAQKSVSIFDDVKPTSTRHKRSEFDGVEEVTIDKFMEKILPTVTSVEAFVSNQHAGNLVALTTSARDGSKPIFKWDNNYSWTFSGNLAGKSEIKEAVKTAGGAVSGVLRFSLTWNEDGQSIVDHDAHCNGPSGHIYFGNRGDRSGGMLDVDMINPPGLGVENITWPSLNRMKDGSYIFSVNNFNSRKNRGFKAEIEFDGEIYNYEFTGNHQGTVKVATVTLKEGSFSIVHHMKEEALSREVWGLSTGQFHKVNLICLSPNHWGGNNVGNKHYMFMLDGCRAPSAIRGFHIENLNADLLDHRKVLEVLGATTMIPASTGPQLAGLGFNATVRDSLVVRLGGTHKRVVRIMF